MKVDLALLGDISFESVRASVSRIEKQGFDGVYTFEGRHDPFLPLLSAALYSSRLQLATGIAVAFARNPMTLANLGYDLQLLSQGRFILGLGSQIRPHIEKRYSAQWSHPAARMGEMVRAVRAIWDCWHKGSRLDFRGRFYTHTLMTPYFNPGPHPFGLPPIYVAAVGPLMTRTAGEVGDGVLLHPFHSRDFILQRILPELEKGLAAAGRAAGDCLIDCQLIVALGDSEEEIAARREEARGQLAFYASTPAYRTVLECHGYEDLQPRLQALTKEGRWAQMSALLPDELLELIALCGTPEQVAEGIYKTRGDLVQRVGLMLYSKKPEYAERLRKAIRGQEEKRAAAAPRDQGEKKT